MSNEFIEWMIDKKGIAETSARKYVSAITVVSSDMIKRGIIAIDLYQCRSAVVLQDEVEKIRCDPYFQEKNRRGNNMYSVALNHYLEFICAETTEKKSTSWSKDGVEALRNDFKKYLRESHLEWTDATITTYAGEAFYAYNNSLVDDFWRLMADDMGLDECFLAIYSFLQRKENKEKALSKAKHYHGIVKLLSAYILKQFGSTEACIAHYKLNDDKAMIHKQMYDAEEKKSWIQDYIEKTDIKYSYKPVLLLAIIYCIKERKQITLENIVKFFEKFYKERAKKGLCIERAESVFTKEVHSFSKAANTIVAGPIRAFEKANLIEYSSLERKIEVAKHVEQEIQTNREEIVKACYVRLDNYFNELETLLLIDGKADCMWLIGRRVQHAQYGTGVVKQYSKNAIKIMFLDGTQREIPLIMASNILNLIPKNVNGNVG